MQKSFPTPHTITIAGFVCPPILYDRMSSYYKTYSNKDIIDIENKDKLDRESEKLENVLANIDIIKSSSENFIQSILDNNPHLKNIKEKKDNNEEAEKAA